MPAMETGRICIKSTGREAGKKAVVLEAGKDKSFVVIIGPKIKKRKCNIRHLIPLDKKIDVKKGITQKELEKILKD